MYIIACIKDRVIYSKEDFITPSLEIAKARLKTLRENGDTYSKVYEIMDLKEIEIKSNDIPQCLWGVYHKER